MRSIPSARAAAIAAMIPPSLTHSLERTNPFPLSPFFRQAKVKVSKSRAMHPRWIRLSRHSQPSKGTRAAARLRAVFPMPPACSVFIVFPPFRDGSASRPFILCGARAFAAAKAAPGFFPAQAAGPLLERWRRVISGPVPGLSYCAPAPGRLCEERQRRYGRPATGLPRPFSRPRRGPVPGRPYCAAVLGRLDAERQRRLPCAKGAVGERRLRDWQRAATPVPLFAGAKTTNQDKEKKPPKGRLLL